MEQKCEEFLHNFRQELLAEAEATGQYEVETFMKKVTRDLTETGFISDFEWLMYKPPRGMRVDGYWFDDEDGLDLFVADFESRRELQTLTRSEVEAAFKRLVNFFETCTKESLGADETTPEYGLASDIAARFKSLIRVRFWLLSERELSDRFQAIPSNKVAGISASYQVWDVCRLQRQQSSKGQKEALDIDLVELFGAGLRCLPTQSDQGAYQSYLLVMPAPMLAALYDKFSSRLLEQNVRTFLQARGQVNKGIRDTILNSPQKFFAYNNGISATAQAVETTQADGSLRINRIRDLQIVNGGQTTASLFHARKRDKADLTKIKVQMKLTVVESAGGEEVVQKISEYANTQNRVSAADFFSNHPFHVRMEGISRRLWAPSEAGSQRETKWFYERARGQYADALSALTAGEQKRFKAEYPKLQMFTKTDLAKFENVFDEHPKYVNLGSQKNFVRYAERIAKEWDKSADSFNDYYFKRAVARALLFRETEGMVSNQPWYSGGYRANIVAYTLAMAGEIAQRLNGKIDFLDVWNSQSVDEPVVCALEIIAKQVSIDLMKPPAGISNIGEWAKKDACWDRLRGLADRIAGMLDADFTASLVRPDGENGPDGPPSRPGRKKRSNKKG